MEKEKSAKKTSKTKTVNKIEQLYLIASNSEHSEDDNESSEEENGLDHDLDGNTENHSSDGDWTSDDDRSLVEKIKATLKENDNVNFKTRLKQVDWKQIAFKKFSAKDCEGRFNAHVKRVRRYRNLKEIVVDVETNIKKAREGEGLSAYHLFVQEQLSKATSSSDFENLTERFKELSSEQKMVYELKAKQLNSNKSKNKNKAAAAAPKPPSKKTPFQLYAESQKSESDHTSLREEYNNMSVDQKYDWIVKAVRQAPESITKILNKEEQRIFKGQINSAPTAYTLYVKEMYDKIKSKTDKQSEVFSQIAQLWKQLDANKKKKYADAAAAMKKVANKEQEEFKERHGLVAPKRRKSTYVEHPAAVISDDDDVDDRGTIASSPKKRKVSFSNASESSGGIPPTKQITLQPKSSSKLKPKSNLSLVIDEVASNDVGEANKSKKKKKNLNSLSESSDINENVTSPKKKSKKEKKAKSIEPPGEKPPPSEIEYFAKYIHTGKPRKAQKAYNKLTEEEKQNLTTEYKGKVDAYVTHLKVYLASLPKEEAVAYIKKAKEAEKKRDQENNSQED